MNTIVCHVIAEFYYNAVYDSLIVTNVNDACV
jgi:hypothetical protein